jgi:hypothetical protein
MMMMSAGVPSKRRLMQIVDSKIFVWNLVLLLVLWGLLLFTSIRKVLFN